jgi:4-hydroxybenzoyl-CoA reductase subunit alpha
MLDYRMSTIAESPPIEVTLVESMDPLGPFGAKEGSEGALHGCPPAIANAIADALGLRLAELPLSPDRVLQALRERQRELKRRQLRAPAEETA